MNVRLSFFYSPWEPKARFGEMEMKLAVTAAGFLGRQMES